MSLFRPARPRFAQVVSLAWVGLPTGKISKVFIGPGKNLIGVDVPDDGDDGIAGPIITTKVGFHVWPAESLDIGHVAYDSADIASTCVLR